MIFGYLFFPLRGCFSKTELLALALGTLISLPTFLTDDFDDFCIRATKLAGDSNGAPLFTVTQSHRTNDCGIAETSSGTVISTEISGEEHEDDWQLL